MLPILFALIALASEATATDDASAAMLAQLRTLGVKSVLVFPSQAIDERPVWSSDGRQLALNVDERWSAVDIRTLHLVDGTWHDGEKIAVVNPRPKLVRVPQNEIASWQKNERFDPRRVTTRTGLTVELAGEDLGTAFRISRKGSKPDVLWKTSLENCHSLALSPDEKLVAFICELNGMIVADIEP